MLADPGYDTGFIGHARLGQQGQRSCISNGGDLEPVTNQVTTTPGNPRHSATEPDTYIRLACSNRT